MVQRVEEPALLLLWLRLLLWHGFDFWPWNFHTPRKCPPPKKNQREIQGEFGKMGEECRTEKKKRT